MSLPAPQALDAERSILAAMMLDADALARGLEVVKPDAFFRLSHSHVFRALAAMHAAREPVDLVTLAEQLRHQGDLAAVGGMPFLAQLLDYATTAANLEQHARMVSEKAALRRLIKTSREIFESCHSLDDVPTIMARAETQVRAITDGRARGTTLAQGARRFADEPASADERPSPLVGDGVICATDLVLLAGKPGLGKSRIAIELTIAAATATPWLGIRTTERPIRAGYLAAEFTRYRWWRRCVRLMGHDAPEDPLELQARYRELWPAHATVITRDMLDDLPDLSTDAGGAQLERLIIEYSLELLTLDPLSRLLGGREETNETFTQLVRVLDRVRYRTKCALEVVHHERKGSTDARAATPDPLDALRGGSALPAAAVTVMRLSSAPGGARRLEFAKVNHAEVPTDIWHRIPAGGGPTIVEQGPEAKANAGQEKIVAWLRDQVGYIGTPAIAKALDMVERTCLRHLEALTAAGIVRRATLKPATWVMVDPAPGDTGSDALQGWQPI